MQLSKTASSFTESVIREMTRICDSVNGINLSQGFPDFPTEEVIKNAAVKAILEDVNQYSVTFGSENLRRAIANKVKRFNNLTVDAENEITVTCGATEAMLCALKAVINPGDEVIIFEPFYENYGPDVILSGAAARYITLHPPKWQFDYEELRRAFNEKTKAIVINTPNNPTGKVFSKTELEYIAKLCKEFNALAICDEIYEHITYDGETHISIASLPGMYERSITINSASKTYSVTGWRVGWAIAPPNITKLIRTVHDFMTVGAPAPLQEAVAYCMELKEDYYNKLCNHYYEARNYMSKVLVDCGFELYEAQGAYYFLVNCEQLMKQFSVKDDFEFSRALIEKTGIATVPGTSFYVNKLKGFHQVRFCYCKSFDTLYESEKRLRKLV
ncbi:aminotransferase [Anaerocolumna cellulosilytica]|uniref:Aminotransferase n=1 Tax=Anaerocolumna cellulosilytica TaxID=433286 RepID=A0A6S6QST1_9FIRM|nr:aminotransferase class I/II-fold pyridoxal phosphate-dependent enzyme [Anaerocolumna cellulosilytica]MBB5196475.1 aminotransferase [Anaerocolumna cellulosilytica]BCJ94403.1 aminotransferase [Anaerocolumna cellulosilytica]